MVRVRNHLPMVEVVLWIRIAKINIVIMENVHHHLAHVLIKPTAQIKQRKIVLMERV
jgi:hypothetical protein